MFSYMDLSFNIVHSRIHFLSDQRLDINRQYGQTGLVTETDLDASDNLVFSMTFKCNFREFWANCVSHVPCLKGLPHSPVDRAQTDASNAQNPMFLSKKMKTSITLL